MEENHTDRLFNFMQECRRDVDAKLKKAGPDGVSLDYYCVRRFTR